MRKVDIQSSSSSCSFSLIFFNVCDITFLTYSIDCDVISAVGDELIKIWDAIVSKELSSVALSLLELITTGLDGCPSGRIEKPVGNIVMLPGSHPVITDCILVMST